MLLLHGAQLALRSIVPVLDLDAVDDSMKSAEIFGSVLSGQGHGGSTNGSLRLAVLLKCSWSISLRQNV